jgi:hypothetical protein
MWIMPTIHSRHAATLATTVIERPITIICLEIPKSPAAPSIAPSIIQMVKGTA